MAVTKTILKNTHQEVIIKIAGTSGSETITLTDLANSSQVVSATVTQKVNIAGVIWSGQPAGEIKIERNSVVVMTLSGSSAGDIDFAGNGLSESTENESDLVITISGGQAELWIRLRKVAGYDTTIETATYGSYDDPTRIGASTTLSGSPDKV